MPCTPVASTRHQKAVGRNRGHPDGMDTAVSESPTIPEGQRCTYRAELEVHQTSFMSRCELHLGHSGGHLAELPALPVLAGGPARTPRAAVPCPGSGTREDHAVHPGTVQSQAVQYGKEEIH